MGESLRGLKLHLLILFQAGRRDWVTGDQGFALNIQPRLTNISAYFSAFDRVEEVGSS